MRVTKTVLAVMLFLWGVLCSGAVAQDDLDLESLLDDLTEEETAVVEEETVSEPEEIPEAEAVIEEAPPVPAEEADVGLSEVEMTEEGDDMELEAVEAETEADAEGEEAATEMPETEEMQAEAVIEASDDMAAEEELFEDEMADFEAEAAEEAVMEDMAFEEEEIAAEEPADFEDAEPDDAMMEAEMAEAGMEDMEETEEAVEAEVVDEAEQKARQIAYQEEVRRQAQEVAGLKKLEAGYSALDREEYEKAAENFEAALDKIPIRPATMSDIDRAKWGLAEADYQMARGIYRARGNIKEMQQAEVLIDEALTNVPDHRPAQRLQERIQREIKRLEVLAGKPIPPAKRPDVLERKKEVSELMTEARQFYKIKDYNSAEALFEKILLEDEYNVDAMRYLKKIGERKYKIATIERDANMADAMAEVRETWNPPIIEEVQLPGDVTDQDVVSTISAAEKVRQKMDEIMIPSIEFRQANIQDVVDFLVQQSIEGDPQGDGVNIILNLKVGEEMQAEAPVQDTTAEFDDMGWGDEFGGFEDEFAGFEETTTQQPAAGVSGVPTITLNLRRISLHDALKIITEVAGLRYRIDGNIVIITPANIVSGTVVTRMYPVQPSILDVIVEQEEETDRQADFIEMGGGRAKMTRGDVKEFFEKAGVPFPIGTSITYNPSISQLIVANTPENLEVFERILAQLNVIPNQVEIEARFVELSQNNLEELGLEWILSDNWEIAQKESSAPIGGRERVQINKDSDGFTKGLRYFGFDSSIGNIGPVSAVTQGKATPMGNLLTFASVLTNPELQVVIHALSQSGGADLLSAPRVTTRSGVNAQIEIVREIIYPTEFEVTQPTIQSEGNMVTPPTVTPGGFETRETGVILNVTPTVGPDGYTIDLTMIPEVSDLIDWIQYGSEFEMTREGSLATENTQKWSYNIPQPVFSSRNVTTSLVIWDGQTVVMGGLMREQLVTMDDKVPILGDIPLLGNLFKSKGEYSQKMNLLIFVTARLVDPAGKPIHKAEAMAMPGSGGVTAEATATP
jgi:general secretion pathway protein D